MRMQNFGVVQLADGLNVFERHITTNLTGKMLSSHAFKFHFAFDSCCLC